MSGLGDGALVAFVHVQDMARAQQFYGDVLGLEPTGADDYGAFYRSGAGLIRLTVLPDYQPHAHPVAGWQVGDVVATVRALKARGVDCLVYPGMGQDELGVWTAPDGSTKLAWFKDPDGNLLSLNQ